MGRLLKRALALVLIGAIAALVIYVTAMPVVQKQDRSRRARAGGDGPVPVVAAQATIADVPIYLNGVGTAKARNTVTVRPQVDGKILSINFKEGQDVKRGDILAKIDPVTYQAQLDQAVAKKAFDDAQLANAERDLERYTQLGGNVVAQKTIDTQRALVVQLKAQIKQDEAAIANAHAILNYTSVIAPIDGRTGIRMVDEGNLVRAADAAAGIVVITEVRPISVLFTLPQQQLTQVNTALAAGTVSVEALDADNKTAIDNGILQVVDNQVDQTTGTVRMKAEFANANLQLWPGQFVNVRILVDTLKQVVVVPTPAVQRGPNGTFAYVIQGDDRVALRPITVTTQSETQAVIAKGIAAADRVVTSGFNRLKDGTKIVLPDTSAPASISSDSEGASRTEGGGKKMRAACADDLQKFCPGIERNREAIRTCLQTHAAELSAACKGASTGQKAGRARETGVHQAEGSSTQ